MSKVEKEDFEYPELLAVAYDIEGNALAKNSGRGFEDDKIIIMRLGRELMSKCSKAVHIDIYILKESEYVKIGVIPVSDEEKSKFV